METFTIRIIDQNGAVSLTNYSFSQVVTMLDGVSKENRNKFWVGKEGISSKIGNLKLVEMEKLKKLSRRH